MSKTAPQTLRIGTVTALKPFRRVDSRACFKCGAVAGRCEHLANDTDIIWLNPKNSKAEAKPQSWTPEDRAKMKRLFEAGYTGTQIGEAMNTTRSAVLGILRREGVRRGGQ